MNYCYKDYSTGGSSTVTCDITFVPPAKSGYQVRRSKDPSTTLNVKGSNGKALDVDGIRTCCWFQKLGGR